MDWVMSDGMTDREQKWLRFDKTGNTHFWVKNGHFNLCMASSGEKKTNNRGMVSCKLCLKMLEETG
jgi:hypothetical protein